MSMLVNVSRRPRTRRIHARALAGLILGASFCLVSASVQAATVTVDLSARYRPATHVGSGFLYGVTEKLPADADLERLVGALHPKMLTNPASSDPGTQQPGIPAHALKVAARVAPFGTTVTVRLADWFSGWYAFTTMSDWLSKIGTTIAAKKAAGLDNIYAYEIWNEPNGSWTNGGDTNAVPGGSKTLSWNAFWKQSYDKIRQLDPAAKITGPSISYMDPDFMKGFLSYGKANDCLPDIIGWHEGVNIESDVASYRTLEKQIGVGPLPITINEYSGLGRAKDEGRPGATIPLIAQLERSGVDSACVSWWLPDSIAGHMGSLLATDTQSNGGWFLFKWYGELGGDMVMTTPSLAKDGKNLDGVASLDATSHQAHVLLGGVSDGTIQVVIKGWKSVPWFGNQVHAVVEQTRWTGRSGVATGTDTVSSTDLIITKDTATLSIDSADADEGYRVILTPGVGEADGGVGDAAVDASPSGDGRDADGAGGRGGSGGASTSDAGGNAGGGATGSTSGGDGAVATGGDGAVASGGVGGGKADPEAGGADVSGDASKTSRGSSGCSCTMAGQGKAGALLMSLFAGLVWGPRVRRSRKS